MRWRTALALACVLALLSTSCLAFSDTLDAMNGLDALTLRLSGFSLIQINGAQAGQEMINRALSPLSAEVAVDAETARLALLNDGAELAALRLPASAWPDTGTWPHAALRRVLNEALPALFDACLPEEELTPEARMATVRNLPTSIQRTTLTVTPAQFGQAEGALAPFRTAFAAMCAHLPYADALNAWVSALTAESDLTLKRLEDADGRAVAWSLSGRISSGGQDVRKLTFTGGIDGMNAYVSLKLPARSGKNSFELTVDLKDKPGKKKNTWSGTVSLKRVLNGESWTIRDTVSLTDEHAGEERLTGSVKRESVTDGIKTVWTAAPDLRGENGRLAGTLKVTKKHAQTQVWQASAAVSLSPGASTAAAAADSVSAFAAALTDAWIRFRASLPADGQRLLDHVFRSDAWLNGTSAPVAPIDE